MMKESTKKALEWGFAVNHKTADEWLKKNHPGKKIEDVFKVNQGLYRLKDEFKKTLVPVPA